MPTAFTRTVEQAQEAGFTPTRRTVSIVAVKQLTAGIVRLTFRDEYIAHHVRPAQFVNLYSSNPMHLMPRPFGVSEVDGDEVSLIFAVVGFGTDEFSKLTAGTPSMCLARWARPSISMRLRIMCSSAGSRHSAAARGRAEPA